MSHVRFSRDAPRALGRRARPPGILVAALVALTALAALPARAAPRGSPFSVRIDVDGPIIAASAGVWLGSSFIKDELPGKHCERCDPELVNFIDRPVINYYNQWADEASDWLLGVAMVGPYLAGGLDVGLSGEQDDFWPDAVILTEALLLDGALNQIIKMAVRRPRPFVYNPAANPAAKLHPDATLSFYSAHASVAFTMVVAFARIFDRRHPDSAWRAPVWVGGLSLASTVGILRAASGKHFWTDVLVGAAAGTAVGFLVTALHEREASGDGASAAATLQRPPTMLMLGGAW